MTPAIDHALQRLSLDDTTFAALCHVTGPAAPTAADPAWDALEHADVAAGRNLPGWVAETGAIVAAPALRVVIEIFAADRAVAHQLWATPTRTVVGSPTGDGRTDLRTIETAMLPLELTRIVGMGPRPVRPDPTPVPLTRAAFADATDAISAGHPDTAEQVLGAAGLSGCDITTVSAICRARRLTWRVTTFWRSGPERTETKSVAVVDADTEGLWLLEPADPSTGLLLRPTGPSTVYRLLLGLLPMGTASRPNR